MRSYCRIKSQIGDWANTILAAWPADDPRQRALTTGRRSYAHHFARFYGSRDRAKYYDYAPMRPSRSQLM